MTRGDPTVDEENKLVTVEMQRLGFGQKGDGDMKGQHKAAFSPNSLILPIIPPKSNYILHNTINTENHYGDEIVLNIIRVGDGANLPSC